MCSVRIIPRCENETVLFAAEELQKYLTLLDGRLSVALCPDAQDANGLVLESRGGDPESPDITDVRVRGLTGTITGSNPRSVLFAVYQYLEALGIRWVRHGADGEYIPPCHDFAKDDIAFRHEAKYPRRAICMEGSLTLENALENIAWSAKLGFNEYYIQHILPTLFFRRWAEHEFNPLLPKEPLTEETVREYKRQMVREIKKRGMILHDVGHGWHAQPFGFPVRFEDYTEEQKSLLALRNGERTLRGNDISSTHMCYSRKDVRKGIVEYCVRYAKNHPETDRIFFPLADGSNNHCECEECSKIRPSDLYVKLLNELDAALSQENLPAKVVIALYCDFLWQPVSEKLLHPDRFLYVFAPFHRTNRISYRDLPQKSVSLPPYQRNRLTMPKDIGELISFLDAWRNWQDVETFTHEYYYYVGEHYQDYGSISLAKIVYEDIRELKRLKMTGMMTCQSQRAFLPTGLGSWVMAKALWDDGISFEAMQKAYFDAAFGTESERFSAYFTMLSALAHRPDGVPFDDIAAAAETMAQYIASLPLEKLSPCHASSIRYVLFHCRMLILQMAAEKITAKSGPVSAETEWKALFDFIRKNEPEVQPVFDLQQFILHITARIYPELSYLQDGE